MKQAMAEVEEMLTEEMDDLLQRVGYGHFACSLDNQPYIVPINYAYHLSNIYFYTTEGQKTEMIQDNPLVCLQVEEVVDNGSWSSVIVTGEAERIVNMKEREEMIKVILRTNPTLTPAISIRWIENWIRENVEAVYRIRPKTITGRSSVNVKTQAAFARSSNPENPKVH